MAYRRLRTTAAARRWTQGKNEVLLIRYQMTERMAVDRSLMVMMQMEKRFDRKQIYVNGLDNPYMQDHARAALVAYMERARINRGGRKPVVAERRIPETRKKAA